MYLHWCAKIKDKAEKLAYQLNEEAERIEKQIRRLTEVRYGTAYAHMQHDVMGKCRRGIKHASSVTCLYISVKAIAWRTSV